MFNVVPTFLEVSLVAGILAYKCGPAFAGLTAATITLYTLVTFAITSVSVSAAPTPPPPHPPLLHRFGAVRCNVTLLIALSLWPKHCFSCKTSYLRYLNTTLYRQLFVRRVLLLPWSARNSHVLLIWCSNLHRNLTHLPAEACNPLL